MRNKTLHIVLGVIALIIFFTLWGLTAFYPAYPHNMIGWMVFIFASALLMLGGDYLGSVLSDSKWSNRFPKWLRVIFLLILIIAFLFLINYLVGLIVSLWK